MNDHDELRDALADALHSRHCRREFCAGRLSSGVLHRSVWDREAEIVLKLLDARPDVAVGTHADWLAKMGARSYARSRLVRLIDPEAPDDQTYGVTVRRGESVWVVPEVTP